MPTNSYHSENKIVYLNYLVQTVNYNAFAYIDHREPENFISQKLLGLQSTKTNKVQDKHNHLDTVPAASPRYSQLGYLRCHLSHDSIAKGWPHRYILPLPNMLHMASLQSIEL